MLDLRPAQAAQPASRYHVSLAIDDAEIRAGLTEMLRAHEGNLDRVNHWLDAEA